MDEELSNVLGNEDLDSNAKAEAIKKLIGANYVPTEKYSNDVSSVKKENKTLKDTLKTKDTEIEGYKNSQLTEDEKLQKALENAKEAERKATIKENQYTVKEILGEIILDKEDLDIVVKNITKEDLELTKKEAQQLAEIMKKQKEATEAKIREELINDTPKPTGGEQDKPMTKEAFLKLGYNEQVKYKIENPEGYKQLFN
ncbi:MAG: hypothetical protein HFJ30_00065 [Clostridia bacterium]|jgi:hypothetical protein|nr:hypothetical protein [Clostridia bacterium]